MIIMETKRRYLLCLLLTIFSNVYQTCGKSLKIAFLAPGPTSNFPVNAANSVDGIKLALLSVLKNPRVLNGHNVEVKYFDTSCNAQSAVTTAMLAKNTYNPDVIVGPPCQEGLKMVAQLCTYWNLPVFSWYHTGHEFNSANKYPTLIRMTPPLHILSKSLVHVLSQSNIRHISMLYQEGQPWSLLEDPVREDTLSAGIELHGVYKVATNMSTVAIKQMFTHIRRISKGIVLVCPFENVRRYMVIAANEGIANGEYTFIHVDPQVYSDAQLASKVLSDGGWKRGDMEDKLAKKAYKYVKHLIIDPITDRPGTKPLYPRSKFSEYERLVNKEARVTHTAWHLPTASQPNVYSPYLCDGVVIWSVLVDMLLKQRKDPKDGKLIAKYLKRITASGSTGHIELNQDLDRLGEVYVLEMQLDGTFKPAQFLRFNKTDGYDVTNFDPSTVTTVNNVLVKGPRNKVIENTQTTSTTKVTTSTTTTTQATTPKPLPTTTQPSSIHAEYSVQKQPRIDKLNTPINVKVVKAQQTNVKTRKKKLDPHLNNFEVRLKKKRKIYSKAQRILDKIRRSGDPNVAEFLRIALDRLNTEEELIKREDMGKSKPTIKKKTNRAKTSSSKGRFSDVAQEPGIADTAIIPKEVLKTTAVPPTIPTTVVTAARTVPTTTTTEKVLPTTKLTTPSTSIPTTTYVFDTTTTTVPFVTTTTLPAPTTKMPQKKKMHKTQKRKMPRKRKNKQKTTPLPTTTLPSTTTTTSYYFEETTTEPIRIVKRPKQRKKWRQRQQRIQNRRRRLRQKWFNQDIPTTMRTTTDPPEIESDVLAAKGMLTSIVNEVAGKLMGEVQGEIRTLKKSINSIKGPTVDSTTQKNTPTPKPKKKDVVKSSKTPSKDQGKVKIPPKNLDRTLIEEISANVLSKLSGVTWLEQTPSTNLLGVDLQPSMAIETKRTPIVPNDVRKPAVVTVPPPTTLPPPPPPTTIKTTTTTTTKKPAPPKFVGNWMSGLPPALSVQLFAVNTVSKKKKENPISSSTGISLPSPVKVNTPFQAKQNILKVPDKPVIPHTVPKVQQKVIQAPGHIQHDVLTVPNNVHVPSPQPTAVIKAAPNVDYLTMNKPDPMNNFNPETIISKITQSVLGEVNKKIDSLKVAMKAKQPTTTTSKPIVSLRKKFQVPRAKPKSKADIVKEISEAVIMQLSGQVGSKLEKTTMLPPTTVKMQEHEPEGVLKDTKSSASTSQGNGGLVDKIASNVFGKMNAKLEALSKSVNNLQQTFGKQELEEMPPEFFGGRRNQMMGGQNPMMNAFGKMQESSAPEMPNMPGMFGMPTFGAPMMPPNVHFGNPQANKPADSTQSPNVQTSPKVLTIKMDLNQMNKMPWMQPANSWMGMQLPGQQHMWNPSGNTRTPWWE